jgi:glycosyltransferase involved in cell wall biosynthesis
MRLVFVIDSFMIGGSELAALRTFRLLRPTAQVAVVHFHADGPLLREYRDLDAEMYHVPLFGITDPRNVISLGRLRLLLRNLRPDVVHSHDAYSNIVMLAAQWPRFATPWVSSRRWLDQIVRPAHARLNHVAFMRSQAVTVNSSAVAAHMVSGEGVPASQIVVVPNFVDVPSARRSWPVDENGHTTIGMVSRLTPIKRHDIALRAIRILLDEGFNVKLHIIGEGESREAIAGHISALGLEDRVVLLGEQRGGALLHLDFDISLSTSDSEGSPNSVLEAMAAGRPVVATDVGGTRDLIRPGVDGVLVPPGNPQLVAAALRDVLSNQVVLRQLGTSGRDRAIGEFSPAAILEQLLTLYRRVST